jgi:hypothetical protein
VDASYGRGGLLDGYTERTHGAHSRKTILTAEKATDFRNAFGDAAQHQ